MYNNVGLKSNKGAGISGFIERSRAYGAIRSMYSFQGAAAPSSRNLSAAAKRAVMQPREAARAYVAATLSERDAQDLVEHLDEHMKLRKVKLDVAEFRKRLRTEGKLPEAKIDELTKRHHQDLLEQYIAEVEARATAGDAATTVPGQGDEAAGGSGTVGAPSSAGQQQGTRKTAASFAAAFGVQTNRGGQAADGTDDGDADAMRFEVGSSFDRRRRAEAKAAAELAYRERREQQAAEHVMKRVQKEVDALRNNNAKRDRDAD